MKTTRMEKCFQEPRGAGGEASRLWGLQCSPLASSPEQGGPPASAHCFQPTPAGAGAGQVLSMGPGPPGSPKAAQGDAWVEHGPRILKTLPWV